MHTYRSVVMIEYTLHITYDSASVFGSINFMANLYEVQKGGEFMRTITSAVLVLALLISCQKKEEKQPIPQVPLQQGQGTQMPSVAMMNPHGTVKKTEKRIEVPEAVKKKWTKAVITIEDKKDNKKTEQTVKIGSEIVLGDSKLTLKTAEFLPDFRMTEDAITTASMELNNPALRVEILENGQSIFKGWLYSKFPDIHPFEHERYSVRLKSVAP